MTIKEKVLRIMELALAINSPEITAIGKTKTVVFVNWMPHCNCLEVSVHNNGWIEGQGAEDSIRAYTDWDNADEYLDDIISRLEAILAKEGEQNV